MLFEGRLVAYVAYSSSEIKAQELLEEDRMVHFSHPALKVGRLLVCKTMQGKGVGNQIIKFIAKRATEIRNLIPIRFLVIESLPQAVEFYEKQGFIDTGIKRGSYRDLSLLYIDLNDVLES